MSLKTIDEKLKTLNCGELAIKMFKKNSMN